MNIRTVFPWMARSGGAALLLATCLHAGPDKAPLVIAEPSVHTASASSGRRVGLGANVGFGIKAKFISQAFTSKGVVVDPDPVPQDIYVDRGRASDKDNAAEGGELFFEQVLGDNGTQAWGLHVSVGYNRAEFGATGSADAFSLDDDSFLGAGSIRHNLDADLWHLNVGLFSESHVTDRFFVKVGAGASAGYISADYTVSGPFDVASESAKDDDFLFGAYVDFNVGYDITPSWSVFGGVRYQYFNSFEMDTASSDSEIDFGGSFVGSVGMRWSF